MNLKQLHHELMQMLVEADVATNQINPIGSTDISKFKIAIISGSNNEENNRCEINFLIGVSVDTYEDLLDSISHVVSVFKNNRLSVCGVRDYIHFSTDKGFEIFTPESGKWIANLSFKVPTLYRFEADSDSDFIFSETTITEVVTYTYE
ncbi:MAG: hypothetical protein HC907_35150 [Richelia sp. SM1_7_0]|nr:hypothetical protein [Richelia sp. SM1_7_0]